MKKLKKKKKKKESNRKNKWIKEKYFKCDSEGFD